MHKLIVEELHANKRLDQYLTEVLEISRSQIQKQIKAGAISINDQPAKPHSPVQTGDIVVITKQESTEPKEEAPSSLEIVYEDDDLMIINKPAGLLVHRTNELDTRTSVADLVVRHNSAIASVGDHPWRPGIVHRLDREVSGVMVIAKTQSMFDSLKKQFQERSVEKKYTALVYGKLPKDHDRITFAIARSKSQGRMVARTGDQEGKEAITEYDVIERFKNTTLIDVTIHTGRTHQIRVHMYAVDHPVVGDRLYRKKSMRHTKEKNLGRLFLHARELTIERADGSRYTATVPLPEALQAILNALPKT